MIRAKGLSKAYQIPIKGEGLLGTLKHLVRREVREVEAVRGLDFEIAEGEFVGFLGANGAGKTTTLKMLTGLIHPSGGEVEVAGHTPFDRREAFLRQITLVMGQKQQLIWDLPARDSLRINAAVYDIPEDVAQRRIAELSEMLDIGDALEPPVRKLSLGQRMKAELLAALLHEPKVLFLDEPTLGLDVNAQASVRRFLKDYNARTKATVLLTSHYMADITALCERVLLIHEGRLVHDGPLGELTERFAPYRELKLELGELVTEEALARFGEVHSVEGQSARLLVERGRLTEVVAELLKALPIEDLTVTEPAIEEVIGKVFAGAGEA